MNASELLSLLRSRRSVRSFDGRLVGREVIERLLDAAVTAPSAANRQPWRFTVVSDPSLRQALVAAVRTRVEEMKALVALGHHAEDVSAYADFLWKPLETAPVLIAPQYRVHQDLLAELLASAGAGPSSFSMGDSVPVELCATSAATMALLVQAQAEGLGACWMTGPLIAREAITALLGVPEPWRLLGLVALGHPAAPADPVPRKPLSKVVEWLEDGERSSDGTSGRKA